MKTLSIIITTFFLGNCNTLFFKPESRVSPICEWRKEKKERLEKSKQSENGNRKNNQAQSPVIEYPDLELIEPYPVQEGSKIYKLQEKIHEYAKTLNELIDTEIVSDDITKLKTSLTDRMDSIHLSLADVYEKQGDKFYTAYNFSKALEAYMDSLDTIREIYSEKVQKLPKEKLDKKIKLTRETGENFLQNKIKTYVDQANYLYLDDQNDKAKEAMTLAREEMYKTVFFNPKTISLYNEQAKIMKLDEFQEGFCKSVFNKAKSIIKSNKEIRFIKSDSFYTKGGIKFTKVKRKDGKVIYVSETIRTDKQDSWYFARNYAERLNLEENCIDCYNLPRFEDIENSNPDIIGGDYFGTWLNSWDLGTIDKWFFLTIGNIYFGLPIILYSFDYAHDVVTHPISWQSYIYPLSPSSVSYYGGSWRKNLRIIRSSNNIPFLGGSSGGRGFRLVRPL